jgi:hypothetical protein
MNYIVGCLYSCMADRGAQRRCLMTPEDWLGSAAVRGGVRQAGAWPRRPATRQCGKLTWETAQWREGPTIADNRAQSWARAAVWSASRSARGDHRRGAAA